MTSIEDLSDIIFVLTTRKLAVYHILNKKLSFGGLHREKELLSTIGKMSYLYFLSKHEEETRRISTQDNMEEILEDRDTLNVIRKQVIG